jgi:hypothetical protein
MAARDSAALLQEEDQDWQPLPPLQEELSPPPLKPPRWLIEAGLLPGDTAARLAVNQQELSGKRKASRDEPNRRLKLLIEAEHEFDGERSAIRVRETAEATPTLNDEAEE